MRIAIVMDVNRGDLDANPVFAKAESLAARGHEVFLLYAAFREEHVRHAGKVRLLPVRAVDHGDHPFDRDDAVEFSPPALAEAIETLHRSVSLDVVEFPEHGSEGHAYLLDRDPAERFPVVVQDKGALPAFASSIGKSDIVFQPNLPIWDSDVHRQPSSLSVLKTETFYHFAVNRAMSVSFRAFLAECV